MRLAVVLCALAGSVGAQTDLGAITPDEKAAFRVEMRQFLFDEPEVIETAMTGPNYAAQAYQDAADADLTLIKALSPQVLAGADIALFTAPNCVDCGAAITELLNISKDYEVNFILHDMSNPAAAALADQLGMEAAPFYVMPTMILRGHMPAVVLTRYLAR